MATLVWAYLLRDCVCVCVCVLEREREVSRCGLGSGRDHSPSEGFFLARGGGAGFFSSSVAADGEGGWGLLGSFTGSFFFLCFSSFCQGASPPPTGSASCSTHTHTMTPCVVGVANLMQVGTRWWPHSAGLVRSFLHCRAVQWLCRWHTKIWRERERERERQRERERERERGPHLVNPVSLVVGQVVEVYEPPQLNERDEGRGRGQASVMRERAHLSWPAEVALLRSLVAIAQQSCLAPNQPSHSISPDTERECE